MRAAEDKRMPHLCFLINKSRYLLADGLNDGSARSRRFFRWINFQTFIPSVADFAKSVHCSALVLPVRHAPQ